MITLISLRRLLFQFVALAVAGLGMVTLSPAAEVAAPVLRINGPSVFGVRPGHPFQYAIPATGMRPVKFSVDGLPAGLSVEADSGIIHGVIATAGDYPVVLHVGNGQGSVSKSFTIKCGEQIALTPPMGWNSWNCWAESVSQEKVLRSAKAMAASGLTQHGWTYINIDDGWQGVRGGEHNGIQGNAKFPDMKKLCDDVHALGLKIGIYSTPWVTSYAGFCGGSSDNAKGTWVSERDKANGHRHGQFAFLDADAKQWAEWGFDYLKYDWNPLDLEHAGAMFKALRNSGRDQVFSLSNAADVKLAAEWPKVANSWRTTGDIGDEWQYRDPKFSEFWRFGVSEIAFSQDAWTAAAGPGHWNDPDMLVVGQVGWGPSLHPTHLSQDEQYTHITMWCMLSAPLLIGCDLEQLDTFTLNLLSNDDVLAIDQDALGQQAMRVATVGSIEVYVKQLEDGTRALAFFNRAAQAESFIFNKLGSIGLDGTYHVRDLWRQVSLPDAKGQIAGEVAGHGVLLLKLSQ